MDTAQHKVEVSHFMVPRSARIAMIGELTKKTEAVWIACHGYGETAPEFIKSMSAIANEKTVIVAPEGLSRFYWGGNFDGKPVASWMTREDRLMEIKDYSNYLSLLLEDVQSKISTDTKIILFGFSQGCATVMRWSQARHPKCDALVLWSGILPEDIDYDHEFYARIRLYCRYGDQDRFLTEERNNMHRALIQEKGLKFQLEPFEGKHKVYDIPLSALAQKIYADLK